MRSIKRPSLLLLGLFAALPALAQQGPPAKPVRLLYDLPGPDISRAMDARPGATLDDIVKGVVAGVSKRLGDKTKVERGGATFFTVTAGDATEIDSLRRRIELSGTLEMRMVATDDHVDADGKKLFDLAREKQRLQDWLDHGGRELLLNDPRAIDKFHGDPKGGPVAGRNLCWFVHVIEPRDPKTWQYSFAQGGAGMAASSVLVSDPADIHGGQIPEHLLGKPRDQQRLLELVAINMNEAHFANSDIDPKEVTAAVAPDGNPCVCYRLRPERCADYGDWTQKHLRHHAAILLNGQVLSAPQFLSRIPGVGQIQGNFSKDEAEALASALKAGPLPVTPVLMRQDPIDKR